MKHCNIPDVWSGDEALAFVAFLQRLIDAIWRAHGHNMGPCLEKKCTLNTGHHPHHEVCMDENDPALFDFEPIPFPRR